MNSAEDFFRTPFFETARPFPRGFTFFPPPSAEPSTTDKSAITPAVDDKSVGTRDAKCGDLLQWLEDFSERNRIRIGDFVTVCELKKHTYLNGRRCVVEGRVERTERFSVRDMETSKVYRARKRNLRVFSPVEARLREFFFGPVRLFSPRLFPPGHAHISGLGSVCKRLRLSTTARSYYELFGLSRTASTREIRKAYRRIVVQYTASNADRFSEAFEKKTISEVHKKIDEAYEILNDPRKRKLYDADQFGLRFNLLHCLRTIHDQTADIALGIHRRRGHLGASVTAAYRTRNSSRVRYLMCCVSRFLEK